MNKSPENAERERERERERGCDFYLHISCETVFCWVREMFCSRAAFANLFLVSDFVFWPKCLSSLTSLNNCKHSRIFNSRSLNQFNQLLKFYAFGAIFAFLVNFEILPSFAAVWRCSSLQLYVFCAKFCCVTFEYILNHYFWIFFYIFVQFSVYSSVFWASDIFHGLCISS